MSEINLKSEIDRFRKNLLDLTKRNALLNYRSTRSPVRIVDELPNQIYSQLVDSGKALSLEPIDELAGFKIEPELPVQPSDPRQVAARHRDGRLQTHLDPDALERKLKRVKSVAGTEVQETGSSSLHLAIGFLEWFDSTDSERGQRAPLILVPVELDRSFNAKADRYVYSARWSGDEVQINLCLREKLRQSFGLELPDLDEAWTPELYFAAVDSMISARPAWRLHREAVLDFFSFAKLLMYLDLDPDRWGGRLEQHELIRSVFLGQERSGHTLYATDYQIDEDPSLRDMPLAVDADSSQHSALADVHGGRSLVIEGPPGTGKSQTITNIIATALGRGQTVLFVAEKLAALQVVRRNLEEAGFGPLCLSLHSDSGTPAAVFKELKDRLEVKIPRGGGVEDAMRRVAAERAKVEAYLAATSKPVGPRREPLHELLWRASSLKGRGAHVRREGEIDTDIDEVALDERLGAFGELGRYVEEVGLPDRHPWRGFDAVHYYEASEPDLLVALDALHAAGELLTAAWKRLEEGGCPTDWLSDAASEGCDAAASLAPPDDLIPGIAAALAEGMERQEAYVSFAEALQQLHDDEVVHPALAELAEQPQATACAGAVLADAADGELERLACSPANVAAVLAALEDADAVLGDVEGAGALLQSLGLGRVSHLEDLVAAATAYRAVMDAMPLHPARLRRELFFPGAEAAVAEVQEEARAIERDAEGLASEFRLGQAPGAAELAELERVLREHARRPLRRLSGRYRAARAAALRLRTKRRKPNVDQLIRRISVLRLHLERASSFGKDRRAALAVGPRFAGIRTDWAAVDADLRWTESLRTAGIGYRQLADIHEAITTHRDPPEPSRVDALPASLHGILGDPRVAPVLPPDFARAPISDLRRRVAACSKRLRDFSVLLNDVPRLPTSSFAALCDAARTVVRISEARGRVELASRLRATLGNRDQGARTDPGPILSTVDWCRRLESTLPGGAAVWVMSEKCQARAGLLEACIADARASRDLLRSCHEGLAAFGDVDADWLTGSGQLQHRASTLRAEAPALRGWANFCRSVAFARDRGLGPFVSDVIAGRRTAAEAAIDYEVTLYDRIVRPEVLGESLRDFSRQRLEEARQRYRELDQRLIALQRASLAACGADREPPAGVSCGRVSDRTELSLITHEVNKQKRHVKLRQLMHRAGTAVQALKPCFMMNPLAIARNLPPTQMAFDLVVMDEASQIKPEEALGAIARGAQVVIVGDPKQLPPTSFFARAGLTPADDDDGGTIADDAESILEVALKAYERPRQLKWHYRSEHESLIAFSNRFFYDDSLMVFPSPTVAEGRLGLRLHRVDGATCLKGVNVLEAEAVARAVIAHAQRNAEESLGVGAFNRAQAEAIEEQLERLCKRDAEARLAVERLQGAPQGLFIKNLENLQGDERDVIFISYTYGPDTPGVRPKQSFGPINWENGWRRLNVLVTRARKRIEVFSTMCAEDILGGPERPRGVQAMKDFLTYADTGVLVDRGVVSGRDPDSPFEEAVGRVLTSMGVRWKPQVGVAGYFIDIGVLAPEGGDFVLGIECDGASYHSSRSARDRDRLREDVIRRRGWNLHRIWSTDWFLNQKSEEERLRRAVAEAVQRRNARREAALIRASDSEKPLPIPTSCNGSSLPAPHGRGV